MGEEVGVSARDVYQLQTSSCHFSRLLSHFRTQNASISSALQMKEPGLGRWGPWPKAPTKRREPRLGLCCRARQSRPPLPRGPCAHLTRSLGALGGC